MFSESSGFSYPTQQLLQVLSQTQVDLIQAQQVGKDWSKNLGRVQRISDILTKIDRVKQQYMPVIPSEHF